MKLKERVWVADNGHRVAVKFSFHQDNGTIHDKVNKFSRVDYECECGRTLFVRGTRRKVSAYFKTGESNNGKENRVE